MKISWECWSQFNSGQGDVLRCLKRETPSKNQKPEMVWRPWCSTNRLINEAGTFLHVTLFYEPFSWCIMYLGCISPILSSFMGVFFFSFSLSMRLSELYVDRRIRARSSASNRQLIIYKQLHFTGATLLGSLRDAFTSVANQTGIPIKRVISCLRYMFTTWPELRARKPVTAVQDCVSTFVIVKTTGDF